MRVSLFFLLLSVLAIGVVPLRAQNAINVFPQVADGVFGQGSYKTAFLVLPLDEDSPPATCTLVTRGLALYLDGRGPATRWTMTITQGGFFVGVSSADQELRSGYAVLTCDDLVYAQAIYSYYGKDGTKLAEATVFASDGDFGGSEYRLIADQRGSQLGLAFANDTDSPRTYRVTVGSQTASITVPARSSLPRFLTEIIPSSANTVAAVKIESPDFSDFFVIGLRYTGGIFTTMPAN